MSHNELSPYFACCLTRLTFWQLHFSMYDIPGFYTACSLIACRPPLCCCHVSQEIERSPHDELSPEPRALPNSQHFNRCISWGAMVGFSSNAFNDNHNDYATYPETSSINTLPLSSEILSFICTLASKKSFSLSSLELCNLNSTH